MNVLDLILRVKQITIKRLPIILVGSVIFSALAAFYIAQKPTWYTASSTIFPLSANYARGSSSPISMLQQQFGIEGEGDAQVFDIKELITSKRLSFKVVNSNPDNKKYDKLFKWIVDDHNSELGWRQKKVELTKNKKDSMSNLITARGILLGRIQVEDAENGYTTVKVKAFDKELARELNDRFLTALSEFYIDFVTEKPRSDLNRIQTMRDSLSIELDNVERAIAGLIDRSEFASKAYVGLPQIKLRRKQQEIQAVYSTTLNALQNARFKLLSESPIFQILDYPGEPYDIEKKSWKPVAVIVFLVSFILLCLWFSRKVFLEIIIEELKKA